MGIDFICMSKPLSGQGYSTHTCKHCTATYMHMHARMHTCTPTCTHAHIDTYTHVHMHTCSHAHTPHQYHPHHMHHTHTPIHTHHAHIHHACMHPCIGRCYESQICMSNKYYCILIFVTNFLT